jgi:putative membrane protein insertion efficiency factor
MNRIANTVLLMMLRGYKWALSPMLPPACRYLPTCSEYAIEAVERYGAFRGTAMAIWRLLRCHPFVGGGYDPVPIRVGWAPYTGAALRRTAEHPISQKLGLLGTASEGGRSHVTTAAPTIKSHA